MNALSDLGQTPLISAVQYCIREEKSKPEGTVQ